MIGKAYLAPTPRLYRCIYSLTIVQRLLTAIVLIVALLLSAALIYFQPGTRSFTLTESTSGAQQTQVAPALPPGVDTYYYWNQHQPLSQQP